jgi:hypothetical protein
LGKQSDQLMIRIKMEDISSNQIKIIYAQVILELLSSVVIYIVVYKVYKEIEISHPVYAIIFCNLITSLLSSGLNSLIFPFISSFRYTSLVNGNNIACLHFHFCCWCILSILRYMYIIKKDWLDENFSDPAKLLKISMFALFMLFAINVSSSLATAIYFGYPEVKIMSLPTNQKAVFVMAVMLNLLLMLLISCWYYFQILRCQSPLGHNSVGVINSTEASQAHSNGLFLIEMVHDEISARENIDIENFVRIQGQAEMNKQQAEKDSAVLSLKTNLSFFFVLIALFLIAMFLNNDFLAIIFSLVKSQAPVVTSIINFVKIQTLMLNLYDECAAAFLWLRNKLC